MKKKQKKKLTPELVMIIFEYYILDSLVICHYQDFLPYYFII